MGADSEIVSLGYLKVLLAKAVLQSTLLHMHARTESKHVGFPVTSTASERAKATEAGQLSTTVLKARK